MGPFIDLKDGSLGFEVSDDTLMSSNGDLMTNCGGGMALDLNTGELHIISGLSDDDDDY
jgi:hypothetical protein